MATYIVQFAVLIVFADAGVCCLLNERQQPAAADGAAPKRKQKFLLERDFAGRWFALHAAWNLLIVLTSLEDCAATLAEPHTMQKANKDYNMLPAFMSMSLHLYHCVAPWFARHLTWEDYMHHFLFAFFLGGFQLTWHWGPGSNWFMFFVTGFPGGLDYLMLALVKNGKIERMTEKRWNSRINTWVRAPGCMATAAWTYGGWAAGNASHIPAAAVAGTAILSGFNGQYYARRVVENHAVCKFESAADRKHAKLSHPHPLIPDSLSDSSLKTK